MLNMLGSIAQLERALGIQKALDFAWEQSVIVPALLEPESKDNYRASRLSAIWIEARAMKA
jgi:hypothetical protein